jgi:hypothetical protein
MPIVAIASGACVLLTAGMLYVLMGGTDDDDHAEPHA